MKYELLALLVDFMVVLINVIIPTMKVLLIL